MKMVMAVVPRDAAESVLQELVAANHTATMTDSRGGMLRQAYQTLFIAVGESELQIVLDIVDPMHPAQDSLGEEHGRHERGGVVFVWDIERYYGS